MNRRLLLLAAASIALSGCATSNYLADSAPIDSTMGYVLLAPDLIVGGLRYPTVDLWIVRVETDSMKPERFPSADNARTSLIALRPGFYYLGSIHTLERYYQFDLDPAKTLFEVRAGQVNYPGDWEVNVVFESFQTQGGARTGSSHAKLRIYQTADSHRRTLEDYQRKFPTIAAKLPGPVYTRAVQSSR